MEIERKFLVAKIPDEIEKYLKKELVQGYISIDPALRLRRSDNEYFFTFKNGKSLVREEFECPLTQKQFENLWKIVNGNEITKDRYFVPLENGLVAELDIYHGRLSSLATVEVEFESVDHAMAFIAPDWFGKDVTDDIRYTNANLSKNCLTLH